MKKIYVLFLAMSLFMTIFSFAGCSSTSAPRQKNKNGEYVLLVQDYVAPEAQEEYPISKK